MAGNHKTQVKNRCSRRRVRRPDPDASSGGWLEILRPTSSDGGAPGGPARVQYSGRWCLVWSDSPRCAGGYSAQKVFPVWRVFS